MTKLPSLGLIWLTRIDRYLLSPLRGPDDLLTQTRSVIPSKHCGTMASSATPGATARAAG